MKKHTTKGAAIISLIPELHPIIPIVRSHHERWDGTGYPDQLIEDEIPLLARIVAVVDAFDAMTMDRPYRKGLPIEVAFDELKTMSGKQFDPQCAAAFIAMREQVVDAMKTEDETAVVSAARTARRSGERRGVSPTCPSV